MASLDNHPGKWAPGAKRIADDLYYSFEVEPEQENPFVWHWCTKENAWKGGRTSKHTLVSRDPLTLVPSIYWPACCGKHGFIREGQWTEA